LTIAWSLEPGAWSLDNTKFSHHLQQQQQPGGQEKDVTRGRQGGGYLSAGKLVRRDYSSLFRASHSIHLQQGQAALYDLVMGGAEGLQFRGAASG